MADLTPHNLESHEKLRKKHYITPFFPHKHAELLAACHRPPEILQTLQGTHSSAVV